MAFYSLSPDAFDAVKYRIIGVTILLMILAAGVGILIASRNMTESSPYVYSAVAVLLLVLLGRGIRKNIHTQREAWLTYELIIESSKVMRRQSGLPNLVIPVESISTMIENPKGIVIKTDQKDIFIFVPKGLIDYDRARTDLGSIREIHVTQSQASVYWSFLAILAFLATFAATMLVDLPVVSAPLGFVCIGALIWSAVRIYRTRQIDSRYKKVVWFIWLPIVMIAIRVAQLLHLV